MRENRSCHRYSRCRCARRCQLRRQWRKSSRLTLRAAHVLGPVPVSGFGDFAYGRPWFWFAARGRFPELPRRSRWGISISSRIPGCRNTGACSASFWLRRILPTNFSVEMDRAMLTYKKNDYLKVSFGKFHTALGFYSELLQSRAVLSDGLRTSHNVRG